MPVIVTETAGREIDAIIAQQGLDPATVCLRVGVKGGGCSGFSYLLDLTEAKKDTDEAWSYTFARRTAAVAVTANAAGNEGGVAVADQAAQFTVTVICDPKSYLYLNGTTVDFKDEIMGRGFIFSNPNATSSCGCGSSFSA
ncbi:MAG: iron-sulfur cluster assembly accessory protein [Phycisphaerales bacterium]|nr:iron-sulfur cluster assembly accessory protein [Phycisphaerales bacterium]